MSTYRDVLAAVKEIRDRTGDPNAWQAGLTPDQMVAVVTPTTRPEQLDGILRRIRQQHPDVFGVATGAPQGEAAKAIADAEAALAHQNSASSQLDLQVVSAILNAHLKTVEGSDALSSLQQETETAVRTRSDLDTPSGARDFQRFLISKLRDIQVVVANANLDDTSKSTLMAAWTSLYNASKNEATIPAQRGPAPPDRPPAVSPSPPVEPDAAADPYLDPLLDDPDLLADGAPAQDPSAPPVPQPVMPMAPMMPSFGGGSLPGFSGISGPGSPAGWNSDDGLPPAKLLDRPEPADAEDASEDTDAEAVQPPGEEPEPPPAGPTTITLPDGETVTAASPQLAAAIKAAVEGAPIADAFHQQGITIPPPGTAVADPIDPARAIPGDIGILRDRHALALGHGKALLDGQIQHIATVSGPTFLGWEHPPATQGPATATPPARTDPPTPTRPAATSTSGD